MAQLTNPLGGITQSTYDGDANLSTQLVESSNSTGAPPVQTNYYYNADDQLIETIVGYGSATPLTTLNYYNPDGNIYCSVSAKAYATGAYACPSWQASWANWQSTTSNGLPSVSALFSSDGASLVTTSLHDPDGELAQQSNPDMATTISVFNGDGEVACAEDAADMAATLAANPTSTYPCTCPASPPTSPPATGSDPGYETSIYDSADRLRSSTDGAGDTTAYTDDPDGSVLVKTGPAGQVTTNCYYWQSSSCASGAPAGGGAANALYSTTSPPAVGEPSGATTTYTYQPGGAAHVTTTAAGTATDTYDAAGDLSSVSYGTPTVGYTAAPNVSYTYFVSGLRRTMADGTGTATYAYDDNDDQLSAAFVPAGGSGLSTGTTSYTYYSTGQQQTLTYPSAPSGGSPTVTDTYNADGELESTTDWAGKVINFTDDPDGNTTGVAYPDDTEVSSTYDYGDAETSLTAATGTPASPGTTLLGTSYSLNGAEQVTGENDTGAITTTRAYKYDSADRLGTATIGSASPVTESYDPSGDPTTLANGTTQNFNGAGQVLTTTTPQGSATYGYNPTGDRSSAYGPSTTAIGEQANDIYTFAGSEVAGIANDSHWATTSQLNYPVSVAIDSSGNEYVVDQNNARVQEVAATTHTQWGISMTAGDAYTVAGSATGSSGNTGDGGPATSALLSYPAGVAVDSQGDLYVADLGNTRVQEVAATAHSQWGISMTAGDVYTVAGSATGTAGSSGDGGPATSALLNEPAAVTVDAAGDLYIADLGNNRVQEVAVVSSESRTRGYG